MATYLDGGVDRSTVLSSRATPGIHRTRSAAQSGPHWLNGAYRHCRHACQLEVHDLGAMLSPCLSWRSSSISASAVLSASSKAPCRSALSLLSITSRSHIEVSDLRRLGKAARTPARARARGGAGGPPHRAGRLGDLLAKEWALRFASGGEAARRAIVPVTLWPQPHFLDPG
jgi:hypothetical protein